MVRRASIIAALVLSLTGAVALALPNVLSSHSIAQTPDQPQRPDQRQRPEQERDGWLRDLNLSSEQQQKIEQIRSRYKEPLSQQRQTMRRAQQELRTLMAGTASTEQVRQKYNQVKALKQQLDDTRFESMLATREILTPEQRKTLAEKMAHRREGFRDRMKSRIPE